MAQNKNRNKSKSKKSKKQFWLTILNTTFWKSYVSFYLIQVKKEIEEYEENK